MKKTLIIIILLLSFKFYSQEIIKFNNGEFEFQLSKDCKESECKIREIVIIRNGEIIQKIIPSENDFYSFVKNETIIKIEDMNFDNHIDFRIIKSIPAEYPDPYLYWIYNEETKLFEKNTDYEKIISPEFDYEKKIIISSWCGYLSDRYKDYYKLIDGIPTLLERQITKPNGKRIFLVETWKIINGSLKLINTELK